MTKSEYTKTLNYVTAIVVCALAAVVVMVTFDSQSLNVKQSGQETFGPGYTETMMEEHNCHTNDGKEYPPATGVVMTLNTDVAAKFYSSQKMVDLAINHEVFGKTSPRIYKVAGFCN